MDYGPPDGPTEVSFLLSPSVIYAVNLVADWPLGQRVYFRFGPLPSGLIPDYRDPKTSVL